MNPNLQYNNYNNIAYTKKSPIGFILLMIFLFLSLAGAGAALYYYLKYSPNLASLVDTKNVSTNQENTSAYAKFDSFKCKNDSEYVNQIIPTVDLQAYDKLSFYSSTLTPDKKVGIIPKTETLLTELILWDDDKNDSLVHQGRALVCIKGKDKVATVEFSTATSSFKNPVRYKDPERNINKVLIQAIYMVPSGADAKPDWQYKLQKNLDNIKGAQNRIFDNKSSIDTRIFPSIVSNNSMKRDFLTQVAHGIVTKDSNNDVALQPVTYLDNNFYTQANESKYPNFFIQDTDTTKYDQVTTLVYFEVGSNKSAFSRGYESGYAFINSALDNGNFFSIIGVDLSQDISLSSSPYHEFMHTLGLPDEYKYKDDSIQRSPTHLFKGRPQSLATLMEDPSQADLNNTYIDDQERVLMGIKD